MKEWRPLTILVADDNETDRLILETITRKEGHKVVSAKNGLEAVAAYTEARPDIVLLDALMPELDGFDAARQIKILAGEELVPIIFLTSLTDTDSLVKCLDAGGDDFLSKPYNRIILQAKIKSFYRMREMHATMLAQRDQIALHNAQFLKEQEVAKQVFDNVAHSGCLDASNVRYYLSSLAIFNGDVMVAARRPSGSMMVLLGDFTGHGLPAAIGAMPLAATFYGMVHKGFSMTDVLCEINGKLNKILPVGIFCCATIIDMNFKKKRIKVWNGGLPDSYMYRQADRSVVPIISRHLPLGVLSNKDFKDNSDYYEMADGDRIFMWTDGIHEARNTVGDMFGEERLRQVFENNQQPETLFDEILGSVQGFIGSGEKNDDLSLLEIVMDEPDTKDSVNKELAPSYSRLAEWDMSFEIKPNSFKVFDPLPLLLNVLMEVPGLRNYSSTLYTIMAELYSNALEHGLLKLDSAIKKTPEGFAEYYRLRASRLEQADSGYIRIYLQHKTTAEGGTLTLRFEDSGEGFDVERDLEKSDEASYSGRGLGLVEKICDSVRYLGCGNQVEVVFSWIDDD